MAANRFLDAAVIGSVSMIFWSLIFVVSVKYAILILWADNRGEGGIVAMLALLGARHAPRRSWRSMLLIIGLIGAALLYGDGAITPAISVLSAIEGVKVDAPQLAPFVVPLTVLILIGLFAVQRNGTGFIGADFWSGHGAVVFAFAMLGIKGILLRRKSSPRSIHSPLSHIFIEGMQGLHLGFLMLGAAFLSVTGGEAMYADLGHFGRVPIRIAWFAMVLPTLALNYFGQGALLITHPGAIENPFYQLSPDWAHYPLVVFATLATIIASQAIISGAFSLTQQAMQLDFLPRMQVKHTASSSIGQIYMPTVNWLLAIATIAAVIAFGPPMRSRRLWHRRFALDGDYHVARGTCRLAVGIQSDRCLRGKRLFSVDRYYFLLRQFAEISRRRLVPVTDRVCDGLCHADVAPRPDSSGKGSPADAAAGREAPRKARYSSHRSVCREPRFS